MENNSPDGCTGLEWIKKIFNLCNFDWQDCCKEHDIAYIYLSESRRDADWVFRQCVKASGHPKKAWIMWIIIRLFGWILYYT